MIGETRERKAMSVERTGRENDIQYHLACGEYFGKIINFH
jgi:hypothetical protein